MSMGFRLRNDRFSRRSKRRIRPARSGVGKIAPGYASHPSGFLSIVNVDLRYCITHDKPSGEGLFGDSDPDSEQRASLRDPQVNM